jgi:hypothetical protein
MAAPAIASIEPNPDAELIELGRALFGHLNSR